MLIWHWTQDSLLLFWKLCLSFVESPLGVYLHCMLKLLQCFGVHCNCHRQDECNIVIQVNLRPWVRKILVWSPFWGSWLDSIVLSLTVSFLGVVGRPLWRRDGSVRYIISWLSAMFLNILTFLWQYLQYVQGLCRCGFGKIDLCYNGSLVTWPPPASSLLHFLWRTLPCRMLRAFKFSWFWIPSASCPQNVHMITYIRYWKPYANRETVLVTGGALNVVFRRCDFKSKAISWVGQT
jgi:hypothetical protein